MKYRMKREAIKSAVDAVGLTMGARRNWKLPIRDFAGIPFIMAALWRLLTFDERRLWDNLSQIEEVRVKYEKNQSDVLLFPLFCA